MGDELNTASQKFTDAKEKADLTEDYAEKWRDLNTAISDGSLSAEELKEAEGKRKEYEQWFINNYGDYIDAEEQKNGIRQESIDKVRWIFKSETFGIILPHLLLHYIYSMSKGI